MERAIQDRMASKDRPARSSGRQVTLQRLKGQLDVLEGRRAPRMQRASALKLWPGLAIQKGALHQLRVKDYRDATASMGFALCLAQQAAVSRSKTKKPRIVIISLRHEANEYGSLYGEGLASLGINPDTVIFIEARNEKELLWAGEEAARHEGVASIVMAVRHPSAIMTLTAMRRLNLSAQQKSVLITFVYGDFASSKKSIAGGAPWRWCVCPAPSGFLIHDRKASGRPSWTVIVEKGLALEARSFLVEWHHETGSFVLRQRGRQKRHQRGLQRSNKRKASYLPDEAYHRFVDAASVNRFLSMARTSFGKSMFSSKENTID